MPFKRLAKNPFVRGSLFVFIASNISSFGNFLYNLAMGRLLEPNHYGDLGALLSLLVLLGIPISILQLFVVKTVSTYFGRKEITKINYFVKSLAVKMISLGVIAALLLIIFSGFLTSFLNLDNSYPFIILAVSMVFTFSSSLNRSALQGLLKFKLIALNSFIETLLRLSVSVVLVLLNFSLLGAISGSVVSLIVFFIISSIELYFILGRGGKKEDIKFSFSFRLLLPSLFTTLSLTIFFTADVILVRHFFPNSISGDYVALSTLGRIIFYAVGPVLTVMFPLISSRSSGGIPYLLPLLGTLVFVFAISSVLIVTYFLFPSYIVSLFYGDKYQGIIPLMGIFSFSMLIFTLNSVLTQFLLSVSYNRPIYFLFFVTLLQSFFIIFIHRSISDIIWINIIVSIIYLSFATYFVLKKEKNLLPLLLNNFSK